MFEFTRKNYLITFFFHALYCAIIFGIIFFINDYLDEVLIDNHNKKYKKASIHFISTLFATFFVVLLFWFVFGWGAGFTPPKK
tara:strand:+ start:509 stop:757 length:249 start_codon:yes stop_codon:yes gene_type:complete